MHSQKTVDLRFQDYTKVTGQGTTMRLRKRLSSPISAAIITGNHDILMEILLLLPIKSLIRFIAVCKSWLSLVFSPYFCRCYALVHQRRHRLQTSFLLHIASQYYSFRPCDKRLFPFDSKILQTVIMQSCNGLLLLECREDFYVYNPTTLMSRKLSFNGKKSRRRISGICLAFDPSESPHYKVFCFINKRWPVTEHKIEVYDSETGTWKNLGKRPVHSYRQFSDPVYWKQGLFFIKPRGVSRCFDLKLLVDRKIEGPPQVHHRERVSQSSITVLRGHMYYVSIARVRQKRFLFLYEMDSDTHLWSKKYSTNLCPLSAEFSVDFEAIKLLGMIDDNSVQEPGILFHVPGKIIIHRMYTASFELLADLSIKQRVGRVLQFIETLVHV